MTRERRALAYYISAPAARKSGGAREVCERVRYAIVSRTYAAASVPISAPP